MVSNTPNSENGPVKDITYVMPAFVGLPGLEEAALAFSRSGAFSEESLVVRAQLALVADHGVSDALALVDDDQLSKAKSEALSRVPVGTVGSYPAVQEVINKIKSSNDPREISRLSSELDAAINSTERLKGEEQDPEVQQQKINRLFAEIDVLEKNVQSGLQEANVKGYLSDKKLAEHTDSQANADKLQAYADSLPDNHPDKAKAQAAAAAAASETAKAAELLAKDAKQSALVAGDEEFAKKMEGTIEDAVAIQTKAQAVVVETDKGVTQVRQGASNYSASTITLGGSAQPANDAVYAYADVSNEHSGALSLPQGGTKEIALNQGKGGGASL